MPTAATEDPTDAHRRWILGRYVQLVALLQLTLYATAGLAREPSPALFYLNPRLLMEFLTEVLFHGRHPFPSGLSWTSLFVWLALGHAVAQGHQGLAIYAIVEGVYALLFLAFAALVVAANMSASHGFSPGELIVPFAVFTAASAGPLLVALPLWRSARQP
jgi:hypothetical protein